MSFSVYRPTSYVETHQLNKIFGYTPQVSFKNYIGDMVFQGGNLVTLNGNFYEINMEGKTYKVCISGFSKQINSDLLKGDGCFEGPWDEAGKKLAQLYFSRHQNGSIIYLNDKQCRILKKQDGSVEFQ